MNEQFKNDIDTFLDIDFFGEEIEIHLGIGQIIKPIVVFDDEFQSSQSNETNILNTQPQFVCKSEMIELVKRKNLVIARGLQYYVEEIQPDGAGMSTVILSHDYY